MKKITAFVCAVACAIGAFGVGGRALAAETVQLDGLTYSVERGVDGSVVMKPQLPKGVTLPYYDSVSGKLYVATEAVIFDAKNKIGLQAYQDCFYYVRDREVGKKYPDQDGKTGTAAEMKVWYPGMQNNAAPSYDRLYSQDVVQVMTWKYYPKQGTVALNQGDPLRAFMSKYVDPGYQLIYLADDDFVFESVWVGDASQHETWWPDGAAKGADAYSGNSVLISFDIATQTGDHGLGHVIENIMKTLTRATWRAENQDTRYLRTLPWEKLNDWEKFFSVKYRRPNDPKKDSDFADLHGSYGRQDEYDYPGWAKPGDLGVMTQLRYEAAWFAAVPHLKEYLAGFWLDYYPEANKVPSMEEIKGLKIVKGAGIGYLSAAYVGSAANVDGKAVTMDIYNIGGSNYAKLRDTAAALDNTSKRFNIGGDGVKTVAITTGKAYAKVGGELMAGDKKDKTAAKVYANATINGGAESLTIYNIGGANYVNLADLAKHLDFALAYDTKTKTVSIDTKKAYGK